MRTVSCWMALTCGTLLTLTVAPTAAAAPAHTCLGKRATIVGTPGNDTLRGTPGSDVIDGLAGHDRIRGLDGNDYICGGAGRDRLTGGSGRDHVAGRNGRDVLLEHSGSGRDVYLGGAENDFFNLRSGADTARGGGGNDQFEIRRINGASGGSIVTDDDGTRPGSSDLVVVQGRAAYYAYHGSGRDGILWRINDVSTPIDVDLRAGVVTAGGERTRIPGFHSIDVRAPQAALTVHGTAGDDFVTAAGLSVTARTGDGRDRLDLSGMPDGTDIQTAKGRDLVNLIVSGPVLLHLGDDDDKVISTPPESAATEELYGDAGNDFADLTSGSYNCHDIEFGC